MMRKMKTNFNSRPMALCVVVMLIMWATCSAQQVIHIWHGTDVDAEGVTLTVYEPVRNATGTAVIVCPGGSYHWLDERGEGETVARALNRHGLTAMVLRYRVAGKLAFATRRSSQHYPMMLADVKRSLALVRAGASIWHIDPTRVGVMGFSAGGHLALMSAELWNDSVDFKPNFVAAIYPVVTLSGRYAHGRSRRGLLPNGWWHEQTLCDSLSMERHASNIACPIYLLNCLDDPVVDYHNSEMMDSALTATGKPHRYMQLTSGGHGFGAGANDDIWINDFVAWLSQNGLVTRRATTCANLEKQDHSN